MGFFSSIGGALGSYFGPIGTAIGSGIGGALDGNKAKKAQSRAIAEQNRIATIAAENASRPVTTKQEVDFEGTIKSARNAGFNPLTALRATGGNITGTTTRYVAPLLSSMPTRNFTDIMSDAFSGYQSFQKGRTQQLQLGLETDFLKSQIARNLRDLDPFAMPKINLGAMYKDPVTGKIFKSLNLQAFEGSRSEIMSSGGIHLGFAGGQELYDWIRQLGGQVVNKQPVTQTVNADWTNKTNTSANDPDHFLKPFHERVRDNYKRENIPIPLIIDKFLKPSAQ
tara:strand:- start:985 stop:1830 length:846 start_codon:yes stop_codon:yes gene_type:complete